MTPAGPQPVSPFDAAKKKPGILPGSFRLENVENVIRITR